MRSLAIVDLAPTAIAAALWLVASGCETGPSEFPPTSFEAPQWASFRDGETHADVPPFQAMVAPEAAGDLAQVTRLCEANGWTLIAPLQWQVIESLPAVADFTRAPLEWLSGDLYETRGATWAIDPTGAILDVRADLQLPFRCARLPQ
jgi:hypothetical protein